MDFVIVFVVGLGLVAVMLGAASYFDRGPASSAANAPSDDFVINVLPWNAVVLGDSENAVCFVLPTIDTRLSAEPVAGDIEFQTIVLIDHVDGVHDTERIEAAFPDQTIIETSGNWEERGFEKTMVRKTDYGVDVAVHDRMIVFGTEITIERVLQKPTPNVLIGGIDAPFDRDKFQDADAAIALGQLEAILNFATTPPASGEYVSIFHDQFGIPIQTIPPTVGPPYLDSRVYLLTLDDATLNDATTAEEAIRYLTVIGETERAEALIERAIAQFPDVGVLPYHRGVLALLAGDVDAAVESFNRACDADAPFVEAQNSLAACYAVEGRYDEAKEVLERAAAQLPNDEIVLQNRIRLHFLRGEEELANALIADNPSVIPPFLGVLMRAMKDEKPSGHVFPVHAQVASGWAQVLSRLGELDEAKKMIERALSFHPNSIEPVAEYGVLLSEGGDDDAAIAWYREKIEEVPGGVLLNFNLANALRRSDRVDEAKAAYDTCIQVHPEWPEARIAMAAVCCDLGDTDRAREEVKHLERMEIEPEILDSLDEMIAAAG